MINLSGIDLSILDDTQKAQLEWLYGDFREHYNYQPHKCVDCKTWGRNVNIYVRGHGWVCYDSVECRKRQIRFHELITEPKE